MVEERREEQNRNCDNILIEQYLVGVTIPNHDQKYPQVPTSHDKKKDSEKGDGNFSFRAIGRRASRGRL
jgi:hypothetical protein